MNTVTEWLAILGGLATSLAAAFVAIRNSQLSARKDEITTLKELYQQICDDNAGLRAEITKLQNENHNMALQLANNRAELLLAQRDSLQYQKQVAELIGKVDELTKRNERLEEILRFNGIELPEK